MITTVGRLLLICLAALCATPGAAQRISIEDQRAEAERAKFPAQVERAMLMAMLPDDARSACMKGEALVCAYLGIAHYLGVGIAKDTDQGQLFFSFGCQYRSPTACVLMRDAEAGWASGIRKVAHPWFVRLCDLGNIGKGAPCANAAAQLATGFEVPRDLPRAAALLRLGCTQGHAKSCYQIGALSLQGTVITAKPSEVLVMMQTACTGGEANGCHAAALLLNDPKVGTPNPQQAVIIASRGCELNHWQSCLIAAGLGEKAMPPMPAARVTALVAKACETQDSTCTHYAQRVYRGQGVVTNLSLARSLFAKACGKAAVDGCFNLGVMSLNGEGGAADRAAAILAFEKAVAYRPGHPQAVAALAKLKVSSPESSAKAP